MIEIYNEYKTSIIGVQKVADKEVSKYGIVEGSILRVEYIKQRIS